VIEIEAIDFGTLVRVDPIIFKSNVVDTSAVFQYLGAVAKRGRITCRFLSTTTADYFTGDPGDVAEWIDNGWIVESEDVHPDAIVLKFWGESDELPQ